MMNDIFKELINEGVVTGLLTGWPADEVAWVACGCTIIT